MWLTQWVSDSVMYWAVLRLCPDTGFVLFPCSFNFNIVQSFICLFFHCSDDNFCLFASGCFSNFTLEGSNPWFKQNFQHWRRAAVWAGERKEGTQPTHLLLVKDNWLFQLFQTDNALMEFLVISHPCAVDQKSWISVDQSKIKVQGDPTRLWFFISLW